MTTANRDTGSSRVETTVAPADGLSSKFCLVTLTAQRAKQLQNGARPRVDGGDHKFPRVAMLEVLAGLISWNLMERP